MNATIDRGGCIGCSLCAGACPEVFVMADDGLAQVIAPPTPNNIDCAKQAADGCPVTVILIED